MSKHRITSILAASVATLAAAGPAHGAQPSLSAAVHLEAHANADTSAAKNAVRTSRARAMRLMTRGTRQLARAAAIVSQAGAQASASGDAGASDAALDAQATLSSAAADQSDTLSEIAAKASGTIEAAARRAQARVEAIRTRADAALDGTSDQPDVVSVTVSADVSTDSGDDGSDAGADGSDAGSSDGISLLGVLPGGGQ